MANESNLRRLTSEQAREYGRRGGQASVKAKKERKTWKQLLELMLATKASDKQRAVLKKYGINVDDATLETVILYNGILQKAVNGDKWAIEQLSKITDNAGTQRVDLNLPIAINVEDDYGDE